MFKKEENNWKEKKMRGKIKIMQGLYQEVELKKTWVVFSIEIIRLAIISLIICYFE